MVYIRHPRRRVSLLTDICCQTKTWACKQRKQANRENQARVNVMPAPVEGDKLCQKRTHISDAPPGFGRAKEIEENTSRMSVGIKVLAEVAELNPFDTRIINWQQNAGCAEVLVEPLIWQQIRNSVKSSSDSLAKRRFVCWDTVRPKLSRWCREIMSRNG